MAGVSAMTVSRVMRNSPKVRSATRIRVLQAAQKINYRPDPIAARLMASVRKGRKTGAGATLALIRDIRPDSKRLGDIHHYVQLEDVRNRAKMLGYGVDEILLGEKGITPARLCSILKARGIEGALFSSEVPKAAMKEFDFSSFCCATFGYGLQEVSVHRASTNMMQGLLTTFAQLDTKGYKRIGMAVTPWADLRSNHTYSGALLHYQSSIPRRRRVPPLFFSEDKLERNRRKFLMWMKANQPDAVISFNGQIIDWIRNDAKAEIPCAIGFVVHDWTEQDAPLSGINHNRQDVAAAAVDLVTTQLYHGEYGLPDVPRQVLISSTFVDLASCPNRREF